MSDLTSAAAREDIIEILDCDLDARPKAAPGVDALLPHVRRVNTTHEALLVEFDEQAALTLEAFVEAERLCCAGIGWEIEREPSLRLRITAKEAQLQAIESLWNNERI
jgi:hypothetical protein